jgi:ribose transport system substrate-binding protein
MTTVSLPLKGSYQAVFLPLGGAGSWETHLIADLEERATAQRSFELRTVSALPPEQQAEELSRLLQQGPDFLIVGSGQLDAALDAGITRAYRSGLPVIVLHRARPGIPYTTLIEANGRAIGRAAGLRLIDVLNGAGGIVELKRQSGDLMTQAIHEGFRDALKEQLASGAMKVIFEEFVGRDGAEARAAMRTALEQHLSIDAVFAAHDSAARGAYDAAQQAGRHRQMKFVGIDALPHEGIAYVKEGILDASVEYPTGGDKAIDIVQEMIQGHAVPRTVTLETRIYTKENVNKGGEVID